MEVVGEKGYEVYALFSNTGGLRVGSSIKIAGGDVGCVKNVTLDNHEGGDWLVYDVSIEGVSLVNNYRTQFSSIISQSSYENLVKRLREKVELK
jgi:ABC-type transporter MlaC component